MQKCDQLPDLTGNTGEALYPWIIVVIGQYNECATIHNGWVDSLTKE